MIYDFIPDVNVILKREDRGLRNRILKSENVDFYKQDNKGISSKYFNETVLQYLIYKERWGL